MWTALALGFGLSALGETLAGAGSREPGAGRPQPRAESREPRAESRDLEVYHVVIGQGAQYWEKYGHNMLWFRDPAAGIDVAYNWGMFDFASPDFLRRQLIGDPIYWVAALPGQDIIREYRRSDRTITLQRLNFTPAQAQRAYEFAAMQALPANREYRYDYYRDNCSTRVRDVIDHALGGALRRATHTGPLEITYRGETLRLLDDMPLIQLGTHVALGQPADRPLTSWESMFIPMRMGDALRLVRLPSADGRQVPLVAQERVLYESPRHSDRASVPALWPFYLIVGLLLGAEFLAVGGVGHRARLIDTIFRAEVALFSVAAGLLGLTLLLAWTITRHEFWFRNENLLLLNPLSLFIAVLALWSLRDARMARPAAITAMIAAGMAALALVLKAVPGFTQNNVALIALLLPAHCAIAWSMWTRRAGARPAPQSPGSSTPVAT